MKLIAAQLNKRLRERNARVDRLGLTLADTIALWRMRLARHRVAIAMLGGGVAGAAFAMRWRSLLRFTAMLAGAVVRTTALSAVTRIHVNRVIRKEGARATRTI